MTSHADLLEQHIRDGAYSGAGLVVWSNGRVVVEHYAGQASPGMKAGPDVLWPIASISKVYTAAAIMRVVEDGALTLNTPVSLVLPGFRGNRRENVRLRHLLTHTAGFIYESPEMESRLAAGAPLSDLVDEALRTELQFEPGTELRYADYNYLVAGHVAEVVTGTSIRELMQAQVLTPAGLRNTFFPPGAKEADRIAAVRGAPAAGTPGDMYNSAFARGLAHPSFGVYATTADLARFGSAFMSDGPRFLSEASVRVMTTDQTGGVRGVHPSMKGYASDVLIPWGIGFALQTERLPGLYSDLASCRTFGHGGASGCELVCDPVAGLVVALTTNTHLRTGREAWTRRLQGVVNHVFARAATLG